MKVTVTFKMQKTDDTNADVSYLQDTASNYLGCTVEEIEEYVRQDEARLAAYYANEWHMIGIRAVATIWIEREGYLTNYTITSPGIWGIESDSGDDYLAEVYADEQAILRADIEAMKGAEVQS